MPSSRMLRDVVLVGTDVSEERNASIIKVKRIGELGRMLAVNINRRTLRRYTTEFFSFIVILCSLRQLLVSANVVPSPPILVTLMMEALRSSRTSVLTRVTRRNIPR
jgi:hypothetical protein